jgi:sporulation protein YlmC with PRC-barrel domain
MRIVRDILDKKIIDCDGHEMGRVDGLVLKMTDGRQPELVQIEIGGLLLAERVARWLVPPVRWLRQHFGPRRQETIRLDWKVVKRMGRDLHVSVRCDDTDVRAWEHWLADNFIGRIPGGK